MRKHLTLVMALIVLALPLASCEKDDSVPKTDDVTELVINAQTYPTVKIGTQTWTAVNYRGSSGINYNNGSDDLDYGKLYTWSEANAITLPQGWRLPTEADFRKLVTGLGGTVDKSNYLQGDATVASKLRSKSGWLDGPGDNSTGFNVFPSGSRRSSGFNGTSTTYSFEAKGVYSLLWSSTRVGNSANAVILAIDDMGVSVDAIAISTTPNDAPASYLPIRFVKDN